MNWTLIDAPFDPARPAMLLFDERDKSPVLVGFSFWVRSGGEPPGFAGDNDLWHRHTSLCIVNGWVDRESESRAACAGHLLAGSDLWMLHAWVVPGWENRWGNFAVHNPALCPSASGTRTSSAVPQADRQNGASRHVLFAPGQRVADLTVAGVNYPKG